MSRKVAAQVGVDIEQLRKLAGEVGGLVAQGGGTEPSVWERAALAAMLHSFYNGIENALKRIAVHFDGPLPKSEDWHTALLEGVAVAAASRPAVIDHALVERLREYMQFRHFFRHSYTFDLKWDKMAPLVHGFAGTLGEFEQQTGRFFAALPKE